MKKLGLLLAVIMLLGACASSAPEATPTLAPTSIPVPTNTPGLLATPTPPALTEPSFIEPIRKQIFRELTFLREDGVEREEAYEEIAQRWGITVDALEVIALEGVEKGWLMPAATATPIPLPPTQPTVEIIPTVAPALPTLASFPTEITVGGYAKVVAAEADHLSYRYGPGLNYAPLRPIRDGTILKVLNGPEEADGLTWWRLEDLATGDIGWMADKWLEPTTSPVVVPTAMPVLPTPTTTPTRPTPTPWPWVSIEIPFTTCRNPQARIRLLDGDNRGIVGIFGTANIDNFACYVLEYRREGEPEWSTIWTITDPVVDWFLGSIDLLECPTCAYWVRLTVVDKTGNYPEPCEVRWPTYPPK